MRSGVLKFEFLVGYYFEVSENCGRIFFMVGYYFEHVKEFGQGVLCWNVLVGYFFEVSEKGGVHSDLWWDFLGRLLL